MQGTITALRLDKGFGFIAALNQPDVFFHYTDLLDGVAFDETLQERRVEFDIFGTAKGPRAANVRPAD